MSVGMRRWRELFTSGFPHLGFYSKVVLIWALIALALSWMAFPLARHHIFPDVDDALRLVQVRDLIAGQGWFDAYQHRINPPAGVQMHWSRIVDFPLAGAILALGLFFKPDTAEVVAIFAIPLILLLLTLLLIARIGRHCFDERTGLIAVTISVLVSAAILQLSPLRIDHHGWLILTSVLALNFLFTHKSGVGGVGAGIAMAVAMSISIETLPLSVVFGAVCALRLLRGESYWLGGYAASLGLSSAALFLATRGLGDMASHCDAMSPGYLSGLFIIAGGSLLAELGFRHTEGPKLLLTAIIIALSVAVATLAVAYSAPHCLLTGAFGELDPLVKALWYDRVLEGLPFWKQDLNIAGLYVLFPVLSSALAWHAAASAQNDKILRWLRVDFAITLCGATILGAMVSRSSATAGVFSTIISSHYINSIISKNDIHDIWGNKIIKLLCIALISFPALPLLLFGSFYKETEQPEGKPCRYWEFLPAFGKESPAKVLAPLDLGPVILERTPHSVVATGHHRGNTGMRDVIAAFTEPTDSAYQIISRHRPEWIVVCPSANELKLYQQFSPDGFWAELSRDEGPEWLRPVAIAPESGMKAWRIIYKDTEGLPPSISLK